MSATKEQKRKWAVTHREQILIKKRIYYQNHKDKWAEYRKNHRDKTRAWGRKWARENKEKIEAYHRIYRKRDYVKVKTKKYGSKYYKKNRDLLLSKNKEYCREHFKERVCHRKARILPKRKSCEICGNFPTIKHHPDYNKPLLVTYLCSSCHQHLHYLLKKLR